MSDIKRMSVKEFREMGYLQELNRQFLHPLGLALEIVRDKEGNERFGEVWDYQDDPEGIVFGDGVIEPEKARFVLEMQDAKEPVRATALGYNVQPVD